MKGRGEVRNKAGYSQEQVVLGDFRDPNYKDKHIALVILLVNREKSNFESSFIGQSFQIQMHSWAGYTRKCVRHVGGNFGDLESKLSL